MPMGHCSPQALAVTKSDMKWLKWSSRRRWRSLLRDFVIFLVVYSVIDVIWTHLTLGPRSLDYLEPETWGLNLPESVDRWVFDVLLQWDSHGIPLLAGLMATRFFSHRSGCKETVCRHCAAVLRGLQEPRCPSCGTAI